MQQPVAELRGISKIYGSGDLEVKALDQLNLTVQEGDYLAVMGASGSGKSTAMNILGCLDRPTSGTYRLNGTAVEQLDDDALADVRNSSLGFVFQQFHLLAGRTALENVEMPLGYASGKQFWRRRELARAMLDRVGLAHRLDTPPERLSGGEQQRVAIARALVRRPALILADEPTGALDVETGAAVMALLDDIATESAAALVTITHDLHVAARARRHLRLADGVLSPVDLDRAFADTALGAVSA